LGSEFITESLKCLADDLELVIMDDSSRYTKMVEHMMLNELEHIWCLYFL